ncbi:MAG TPA: SGNH/GDSL hydrolase family protein [Lentimicrobium sp.]|nr:SGNH/GDSL hydrolase family protein [Lentimicrobium sp.]
MKNKYNFLLFVLAIVAISACKPEIDDFQPSAGNADFSKYVALGNSLTAGYKDGALFESGQQYSYPNILAEQLKLVGGGEFTQPLMKGEFGFGGRKILGIKLATDCAGNPIIGAAPSLSPINMEGIIDLENLVNKPEYYTVNNLGVPGAKASHLLAPGYGSLNPYYGRFANAPNASILGQAMSLQPTFFTLWIGNNDVLTYALAGGEADSVTSVNSFPLYYGALINTLTSAGAKGAVATVPDVDKIAYFTTIPYNALVLSRQGQADSLSFAYMALGIQFNIGQNPFIIQDADAPGGLRQIKSTELLLLELPQDSLKCAGWGSVKPIPAKYVLDESEINEIRTATTAYNQTIKTMAQSKGLAVVDANEFFLDVKQNGIVFDGVKLQTTYISGGLNSIDGIHLTPKGNAVVANLFIEAINSTYGSKIPLVDITEYPGIEFP